MKTLTKPITLVQPNLLGSIKGWFIRPVQIEKRPQDSIFSLASQRCAGYTTRLPMPKERAY